MLKKIITGYLKQREIEQKLLRKAKFNEIRKATEDYYIDLANANGQSDLPYFIKAEQVLNEVIKTPADIDYYYNRLIRFKKLA